MPSVWWCTIVVETSVKRNNNFENFSTEQMPTRSQPGLKIQDIISNKKKNTENAMRNSANTNEMQICLISDCSHFHNALAQKHSYRSGIRSKIYHSKVYFIMAFSQLLWIAQRNGKMERSCGNARRNNIQLNEMGGRLVTTTYCIICWLRIKSIPML